MECGSKPHMGACAADAPLPAETCCARLALNEVRRGSSWQQPMPARMCLLCSAPTLPYSPAAGRSDRGHDHGEAVHFARVLAEESVIGAIPTFLPVSCGRRARKRRTSAPGHDLASCSTTVLRGVLLGEQVLPSLNGEFGYLLRNSFSSSEIDSFSASNQRRGGRAGVLGYS